MPELVGCSVTKLWQIVTRLWQYVSFWSSCEPALRKPTFAELGMRRLNRGLRPDNHKIYAARRIRVTLLWPCGTISKSNRLRNLKENLDQSVENIKYYQLKIHASTTLIMNYNKVAKTGNNSLLLKLSTRLLWVSIISWIKSAKEFFHKLIN